MRRAKSRSYTRTTKKQQNGLGVTNQFDTKWIYRRKRMPAGKRRRWVRALKRNRAMLMTNVGTTSIVFNDTISSSFTGSNQSHACFHLYGNHGTGFSTEKATNDLSTICSNDTRINENTEKFIATSAVLDMTFTNTGVTKLEIDVYTMKHMKDSTNSNFANDLNAAALATVPPGATEPAYTIGSRGVTYFQLPMLGHMGIKIWTKKKYFLAPGEVFTYQIRDPKNRLISTEKVNDSGAYTLKGLTTTVGFIVKSVPGTVATDASSYSIGGTRTYAYKIIADNKDFEGGFFN